MKRIILLLATTLLMSFATEARAGIDFGLSAGTTMSKVDYHNISSSFSPSNRYGWYFGPKVNVSFMGFGVDAAALFNSRRYNLDDNYSKTFQSVELPINAKYSLGLGSTASFFLATGPQFGFNVGNKNWDKVRTEGTAAVKSTFKKKNMNVSWNIGGGVRLLKHLEAGVTYNIMLSKYADVIKKSIGSSVDSDDYNFKANTISMHVCYYF